MLKSTHIVLFFWCLSILALGVGNPQLEMWWVPTTAFLLSILCWIERIQIPTDHRIWIAVYILWWLGMLIPLPIESLSVIQYGLGEYRGVLHDMIQSPTGTIALNPTLHLLNGGTPLLLYGFVLWSAQQRDAALLTRSILGITIGFVLLGLLQHLLEVQSIYGWITVPAEQRSPFFGSFINGNHAGYFVVCGLFVNRGVYTSKSTPLHWLNLVLLWTALYICQSRGAIGLGIVSMVWLYKPKLLSTLGSGLIVGSILIGIFWIEHIDINSWTHGRLDMWHDALSLTPWSWMFGLGFGGFSDAFPLVKSTPEYIHSTHLHMDYLEWLFHTGLLGLALIIRVGVGLFKASIHRKQHQNQTWLGIILILGLASLVDFPLQLNALALLFALALGQLFSVPNNTVSPSIAQPSISPEALQLPILTIGVGLLVLLLPFMHPRYSLPNESESHEERLRSHTLNSTLLENVLWSQISSIPTDTSDRLLFTQPIIEPHASTIGSLHPTIIQHAHFYKSNIEAQRLLARWFRKLGDYNESCRIWQHVWSLETPILSDKNTWLAEGLACDPNIWLVLSTLPEDVDILLEAAKLLNAQHQSQATRFALERAFEVENPPIRSSIQLTQWFIQQKDFKRAWTLHQSTNTSIHATSLTNAQHCAQLKNAGELGLHFNIKDTHLVFEQLLQSCGRKPHWKNQFWFSALKEGSQTEEVEQHLQNNPTEKLLFWKYLVHAYILQQNPVQACTWMQFGFHKGKHTLSEYDVTRCASGKTPKPISKWTVVTTEIVDGMVKP